jgi:hypothetical protein
LTYVLYLIVSKLPTQGWDLERIKVSRVARFGVASLKFPGRSKAYKPEAPAKELDVTPLVILSLVLQARVPFICNPL